MQLSKNVMFNLKTIVTILIFLLKTSVYSQSGNCIMDTSYHNNGIISSLFEWDAEKACMCGYYAKFDSLGNPLLEGKFEAVDSIKCLSCFDNFYDPPTPNEYSRTRELKVGVWKYYHSNGQIKEIGVYSKSVHEYQGTTHPFVLEDRPYNTYSSVDYLKNGIWEYYDEFGNNYLSVKYVDGQIIYKTERY